MKRCEASRGGSCARPAIWKQPVYGRDREAGQFLFDAYWCGEHAERVAQRRAKNNVSPAKMTQIVAEAAKVRESNGHA